MIELDDSDEPVDFSPKPEHKKGELESIAEAVSNGSEANDLSEEAMLEAEQLHTATWMAGLDQEISNIIRGMTAEMNELLPPGGFEGHAGNFMAKACGGFESEAYDKMTDKFYPDSYEYHHLHMLECRRLGIDARLYVDHRVHGGAVW